MAHRQLVRQAAAEKEVVARPTLIAVPAGLVTQTFEDIRSNFPELKLWCFYKSADHCKMDDPRRDVTLSTAQLDAKIEEWYDNRGDPETALNVVVSAYTTMASRWGDVINMNYDADLFMDSWVQDHMICRADKEARKGKGKAGNGGPASSSGQAEQGDVIDEEIEDADDIDAARPSKGKWDRARYETHGSYVHDNPKYVSPPTLDSIVITPVSKPVVLRIKSLSLENNWFRYR